MSAESQVLLLFTSTFPFIKGISEVFIESELPVLAQRFRHVYLFPENWGGELRNLPWNVTVVELDERKYSTAQALRSFTASTISLLSELPVRSADIPFLKEKASTILRNAYRASLLENWMRINLQGISFSCYSYWFNNWSTVLGLLKKKKVLQHYISRAHGYDLYFEVNRFNHIADRRFQMKTVDKIFSVSKAGYSYLRKNFPAYQEKITWSYLGSEDYDNDLPLPGKDNFIIVSCSAVKDIKRVHLFLEVFKHVDFPVTWIHLGGGEKLDELKEKARCLPPHITVDFRGQLSRNCLFEFYQSNFVHLFMNLSLSEGLPVSIMEAISCGIPVIATNAGGTGEIVNETTGDIIDIQFNPEECAKLVRKYFDLRNEPEYVHQRKSIRQFWQENFKAETNFTVFADEVSKFSNTLN